MWSDFAVNENEMRVATPNFPRICDPANMYATPIEELAGTPPGVAASDALKWKIEEEARDVLRRAQDAPPPDVPPRARGKLGRG